jgi:hypothetical protein
MLIPTDGRLSTAADVTTHLKWIQAVLTLRRGSARQRG